VFLGRSSVDIAGIDSALAVALHMHQPLIPAGGPDLRTAATVSNLQWMPEHPDLATTTTRRCPTGATSGWGADPRAARRGCAAADHRRRRASALFHERVLAGRGCLDRLWRRAGPSARPSRKPPRQPLLEPAGHDPAVRATGPRPGAPRRPGGPLALDDVELDGLAFFQRTVALNGAGVHEHVVAGLGFDEALQHHSHCPSRVELRGRWPHGLSTRIGRDSWTMLACDAALAPRPSHGQLRLRWRLNPCPAPERLAGWPS
jgi:hypothetical protein